MIYAEMLVVCLCVLIDFEKKMLLSPILFQSSCIVFAVAAAIETECVHFTVLLLNIHYTYKYTKADYGITELHSMS